ncbi:hypothetical protein Anas_10944 [Armadillidium nasatum]|uniref:C2H2-type domain-containing protein n=1 Tax=Armadillidium nasatum TaxID=96803 RepID=A0A5N5SLH5_9CRUS|nr:hypothetical protein Anas_10944 [Armadillidium nasatum]
MFSYVQELLEEYQIDGEHHCITCAETIARKADYLVHVDTHKDFMPWECTICGTRFKIRGSLKEHLRYTHMKGRVPCLKCNKVFPTSTLLRQHVKVHTQHYKYKSAKNREEELRAAMEATAGALEGPVGTTSPEENEKLSHEANEYRNWCKLMEMNALKNLSTTGTMGGSSAGDDDEDESRMHDIDGNASGEEGNIIMGMTGLADNSYPENLALRKPFNSKLDSMSS